MNRLTGLLFLFLVVVACRKQFEEPMGAPHPAMLFTNLADTSIAAGRIAFFDLDHNGEKDVFFFTKLVADPLEQKDKLQWHVGTSSNASLPANSFDQIPMLTYLDSIPIKNFSGYAWLNYLSILLTQKNMTIANLPYWDGDWKHASHRFIGIQLNKQEGLVNGWIEVSFSMDKEKLILHKAAISKEVNKSVSAGR